MTDDSAESTVTRSRMYISIFLSLLLAVIDGTGVTWASPMIKKLNGTEDNPLGRKISSDESSLLVSLPVLGTIFGSLLIMTMAHKVGRKPLMTMMGIPPLFSFMTLAFSHNIWLYYVARVVSGLISVTTHTLVPMYICELADSDLRGRLAAGMGVCLNIGLLITYSVGPYTSFFWYHIYISIIPVSFIILFSIFALESPYYYLQSDPARAEELLKQLKGVEDVTDTLNNMTQGLRHSSKKNFFTQIKVKGTQKALLIGLGLVTFMECSGTSVVTSYTQFIFDTAGGTWSGEVDNIILGTVAVTVSICSSSIMDRYERKCLLCLSTGALGISIGILSLYFILKENGTNVRSLGWVPLASLLGFFWSYNVGLGPVNKTVLGELFPLNIKNEAMTICSLWLCALGFLLKLVFQRMEQWIGMGGTFGFFSIMALTASIFTLTFIVETKGKTLEEIQDDLNEVGIKNRTNQPM